MTAVARHARLRVRGGDSDAWNKRLTGILNKSTHRCIGALCRCCFNVDQTKQDHQYGSQYLCMIDSSPGKLRQMVSTVNEMPHTLVPLLRPGNRIRHEPKAKGAARKKPCPVAILTLSRRGSEWFRDSLNCFEGRITPPRGKSLWLIRERARTVNGQWPAELQGAKVRHTPPCSYS